MGNDAISTDKVDIALNPTVVRARNSEDIVVHINDSENKNQCANRDKVGCKRSAKTLQQSAQAEEEEVIGLFQKRNYKVRIYLGVNASVMNPVEEVLDTGACPNLIKNRFIPPRWTKRIEPVRDQNLRGATSDKLNVLGVINFQISIGYLRAQAWFSVFDKFVVKFLVGTSFIDRFLKYILLDENVIFPKNSNPVAILAT